MEDLGEILEIINDEFLNSRVLYYYDVLTIEQQKDGLFAAVRIMQFGLAEVNHWSGLFLTEIQVASGNQQKSLLRQKRT